MRPRECLQTKFYDNNARYLDEVVRICSNCSKRENFDVHDGGRLASRLQRKRRCKEVAFNSCYFGLLHVILEVCACRALTKLFPGLKMRYWGKLFVC
jgi:hypothetical protein